MNRTGRPSSAPGARPAHAPPRRAPAWGGGASRQSAVRLRGAPRSPRRQSRRRSARWPPGARSRRARAPTSSPTPGWALRSSRSSSTALPTFASPIPGHRRPAANPQPICAPARIATRRVGSTLGHNRTEGGTTMRKLFEIGGILAGAVLIIFGIAAIYMGVDGRSTVRDSLSRRRSSSAQPTIRQSPSSRPSGPRSRSRPVPRPAHSPRSSTSTRLRDPAAWPTRRWDASSPQATRRTRPVPATRRRRSRTRRETRFQLRPRHVDHRDGAFDRTEHELHGRAARALRHRRRSRPPAQRRRLHHPRPRRRASPPRGGPLVEREGTERETAAHTADLHSCLQARAASAALDVSSQG